MNQITYLKGYSLAAITEAAEYYAEQFGEKREVPLEQLELMLVDEFPKLSKNDAEMILEQIIGMEF